MNSQSKQEKFNSFSSIFNNLCTSITTHFNKHLPNFSSTPPFARISNNNRGVAMSSDAIEERLAGVPVYALSNSNEEFVLVSGNKSKKSLGLFCFKKEDADCLLDQMKLMEPNMRTGSSVVAVALNKLWRTGFCLVAAEINCHKIIAVFQLKVNGVAFRLIPEASQIKNAMKEKEKAGSSEEEFVGVPVFQSRSLTLRANGRTYRPVFFRKEDLENSLFRASKQQRKLNPIFRHGDIEVAVLEEIVREMKDESCKRWDDVVFIPPGFDVSANPNQETAAQ